MLLKAFSEQGQAGQAGDNWFGATANVPYLTGQSLLALTNSVRSTAYQAITKLTQGLAPQLAQIPSVAPVTPEAIQAYQERSAAIQAARDQAGQDEYTAYMNQIGIRPDLQDLFRHGYTQDSPEYQQRIQQIQSGGY